VDYHDVLYSDIYFNLDSNQQEYNQITIHDDSMIHHTATELQIQQHKNKNHDVTWSSNVGYTEPSSYEFFNNSADSYLRLYNLTLIDGDMNNVIMYASKLITSYHDLSQGNNGADSWRIQAQQGITDPLPYVSPSIPLVLPPKYINKSYPLLNHRNNRETAQEYINQVFPVCFKNINVLIAEQIFFIR